MFKGFALGAPYINAIGMARSPLTAAMVGKTLDNAVASGKVTSDIANKYGTTLEQIFTAASALKNQYGEEYKNISPAAIGVYNYFDRLNGGLQQLMCGARKFNLGYITRDDLVALTPETAAVTGISFVMDADAEEVEKF